MDYTRNELGQIDSVTTTQGTTNLIASNLGYEPFGFLMTATTLDDNGSQTAKTYSYDALGNITYKSDISGYTYGENGAGIHAVTTAVARAKTIIITALVEIRTCGQT